MRKMHFLNHRMTIKTVNNQKENKKVPQKMVLLNSRGHFFGKIIKLEV